MNAIRTSQNPPPQDQPGSQRPGDGYRASPGNRVTTEEGAIPEPRREPIRWSGEGAQIAACSDPDLHRRALAEASEAGAVRLSMTDVRRMHIVKALTSELGKRYEQCIRERKVAT